MTTKKDILSQRQILNKPTMRRTMKSKHSILFLLIIAVSIQLVGCASNFNKAEQNIESSENNPLLINFNELNKFGELEATHIPQATQLTLNKAQAKLDNIIKLKSKERNFDNTVLAQDKIWNLIGRVEYPIYLMNEVHPDSNIRNEAEKSILEFSEWQNNMSLNEDLYNAVEEYSKLEEVNTLSKVQKRLLDDIYKGFIRQGFNLTKEKRDSVKAIKNRLQKIGLEFSKNISTYSDTLEANDKDLEGLPDWYKNKYRTSDGTYKLDISYPTRLTFMQFSESEEARKAYTLKFLNRAADKNLKVIKNMVIERLNLATYWVIVRMHNIYLRIECRRILKLSGILKMI